VSFRHARFGTQHSAVNQTRSLSFSAVAGTIKIDRKAGGFFFFQINIRVSQKLEYWHFATANSQSGTVCISLLLTTSERPVLINFQNDFTIVVITHHLRDHYTLYMSLYKVAKYSSLEYFTHWRTNLLRHSLVFKLRKNFSCRRKTARLFA